MRLVISVSCVSRLPVAIFFLNDPAPTEIYTLSLHDALPICGHAGRSRSRGAPARRHRRWARWLARNARPAERRGAWTEPTAEARSEEHTSELQSLTNLVCRLLLEKTKIKHTTQTHIPAHGDT